MSRPDCRTPDRCIARSEKHCAPCTIAAKHKDPAFREKRAQAFRDRLNNDPEFRAKRVAACQARVKAWRARPDTQPGQAATSRANLALANTPENHAMRAQRIRARAYPGIPPSRWDQVRQLARQMPAEEAKRIVREDIAAEARRIIAANENAMAEREARRRAQEY